MMAVRLRALLVLGLVFLAAFGGGRATQAQVSSFSVDLSPGFNNVPYLGATQPVEEAIAPLGGSVSSVFAWDATSQGYLSYNADFPFLSTLTQLEPGQSLWINVTDPVGASWSQTVGALSSSVSLSGGFNLVTWTGADGTAVAEAFAGLALERAWVWDPFSGSYDSYTPGAQSFLNTLSTLDFGDGVWLLMPYGQTWNMGGGGGETAASVEAIASEYASEARTGADAQDAFLEFSAQLNQAISGVGDPAGIEPLVGEAQARAIIANPSAAANLATTDAALNGFTTTFDASGLFTAQTGTPEVSVHFVNGVLNSAAGAGAGAGSLSGAFGVPVELTYNHGILETSGYQVEACRRALLRDYPYYEEARGATSLDEADIFFMDEQGWLDWIASSVSSAVGTVVRSGLSAACTGIDTILGSANFTVQKGWELLKNNAQLALQRVSSLDFANSTVNAQLVPAIKTEITCGNGVVLLGHSQGTLFVENAFQQVKAWWESEGRQLLNSSGEVPMGVLYISPAFDAVQGTDQRYVRLDFDVLALTTVTISPPTVSPTTTQRWPPYILPAQTFNLHLLSTYMEAGSPSRAQIVSAYNGLRSLVQSRAAEGIAACGRLQATLTWNVANDVDLYVTEPDGTLVYFRNTSGSVGALDRDDTQGTGPENYRVLEGATLQTGTYQIGVNYFASRTEGPVQATVTVTAEGTTQSRTVTLSAPDRGATIVPMFTVEVSEAPPGSASPFVIRILQA